MKREQLLIQSLIDTSNSLVYSDVRVDGKVISGGCSDWNKFLSALTVSSITRQVIAVQLITVTSLLEDVSSNTNHSIACASKVGGVVSGLIVVFDGSGASPQSTACTSSAATTSPSHYWTVGACASGAFPALCIDCQSSSSSLPAYGLFPCGSSSCLLGGRSYQEPVDAVRALVVTFRQRQPAPIVRRIQVTPALKSASVAVTLDSDGFVYCSAFVRPPASTQVIFISKNIGRSVANQTTIELLSLVPSTSYRVYCLAVSTEGVQSQLPVVLDTSVAFNTRCCFFVVLTSSMKSALAGEAYANAIKLSLDGAPSDIVGIRLHAEQNRVISNAFFPSQISFTASSALLSASVALTGIATIGSYTVNVTIAGPSAAEYSLTSQQVMSFQVIAPNEEPPLPMLIKAQFSSDGSSVLISFDSATNKEALQLAAALLPAQHCFSFRAT